MSNLIYPNGHITWDDIACKDKTHTTYPINWRNDELRLKALVEEFENIRAECSRIRGDDCPIDVLEGYRTLAYQELLRANPKWKAAKYSQHCEGRALDITTNRITFKQFEEAVLKVANRPNSKIKYVELRPSMGYIHFDVRLSEKLVVETIS